MATYWENSCSFGLRYVSWYKYLIVSLVFSHLGFWSGNLFLIAPFPDLCLLVPFYIDASKQNNLWVPKWTTQSGIAEYCQELQKCGCIKLQFTGNATVQAFHVQKCVHVAVKKTNKSYSCEQLS